MFASNKFIQHPGFVNPILTRALILNMVRLDVLLWISVIPSFRSKSSNDSKMISPKTGRNSVNTSWVIFLSLEYSSVNLDRTPSAIFEIVFISTKSHIFEMKAKRLNIYQYSVELRQLRSETSPWVRAYYLWVRAIPSAQPWLLNNSASQPSIIKLIGKF